MNRHFRNRAEWARAGFAGAFTSPVVTYRRAVGFPVNQDEGLSIYLGLLVASSLFAMVVLAFGLIATLLVHPTPFAEVAANRVVMLVAICPGLLLILLAQLRWGFGEIFRRLF